MKLYTFYDTLAEVCSPLFEARNDAVAKRIYDNLKDLPPGSEKKDFRLLKCGSVDKETGTILGMSKPLDITRVSINALEAQDENIS